MDIPPAQQWLIPAAKCSSSCCKPLLSNEASPDTVRLGKIVSKQTKEQNQMRTLVPCKNRGMRKVQLACCLAVVSLFAASQFALAADPAHPEGPTVAPTEAISKLKEGNGRYAGGNLQHPGQTTERRAELANTQHPFAIIVSCSDSRVPPEIVFDQGLGDLFVVRVAG